VIEQKKELQREIQAAIQAKKDHKRYVRERNFNV